MREHAVELSSIDPADDHDFSDLEPLRQIIGDAQVVQLGEQSHGDGACFQTKIRLIKYLHQKMGFDVLAFESGLYDCQKAWQAFQEGLDPLSAARLGGFGIWTESAQTEELWNYLARCSHQERPLELCGFDCQFTAAASRISLRRDLRELAQRVGIDPSSSERWKEFDKQLGQLLVRERPAGSMSSFVEMLQRIGTGIDEHPEIDQAELIFWKQQLKSMADHCARQWKSEELSGEALGRDRQMAKNLIWLSDVRYLDRKIIVWAASFHIVRNPPAIEVLGKPAMYEKTIQMGELVDRALGERVFTIGFTAYQGRAGAFFRSPFQLTEPPEGTLESLMAAAGLENAIVPLRSSAVDAKWLSDPIYARPLAYHWMKAQWPKHFDAIIFNRTMTPSTRQ